MNETKEVAGEALEPGDMVYMVKNRVYKVCDDRQITRGVISKHCGIGDVVDDCILGTGIAGHGNLPDGCIGIAGEDLIEGGPIGLHADGKWYNKRPQNKRS